MKINCDGITPYRFRLKKRWIYGVVTEIHDGKALFHDIANCESWEIAISRIRRSETPHVDSAPLLLIPEPETAAKPAYGINPGFYDRNALVRLLRKYRRKPNAI